MRGIGKLHTQLWGLVFSFLPHGMRVAVGTAVPGFSTGREQSTLCVKVALTSQLVQPFPEGADPVAAASGGVSTIQVPGFNFWGPRDSVGERHLST